MGREREVTLIHQILCKKGDQQSRLEHEVYHQIDHVLTAMLLDLDNFCYSEFAKRILVTSAVRTKEENKAVGGVEWSGHLYGRAVDIRSWTFKPDQIKAIEKYLKDVWGGWIYFKHHDTGQGVHIHLGIPYKYRHKERLV